MTDWTKDWEIYTVFFLITQITFVCVRFGDNNWYFNHKKDHNVP